MLRDRIVFYLNGKRQEVGPEKSGMMLADYLRYERSLTGTKIVCAEGDCGACTVLRLFPNQDKASYLPVNSCILTVAQVDGSSLVTVDALQDEDGKLSPAQEAMMVCHGSQCGFCTPGFVMAMTGLVEKKIGAPKITAQDAKNALTGNLCRCTGYQPIIDAATSLNLSKCESVAKRFYSKEQEKELRKVLKKPLRLDGEGFSFYAPTSLKEAAVFLKKNPKARIISGGTDLGVVHNKWKNRLRTVVSLHLIPELYKIRRVGKSRISVGARVSLSELREATKTSIPELARFLDIFASPQIKNIATLAGNLANASPIGDTPPFLLVAGATQTVHGPRGKRSIPIEKFFLGYRKTSLAAGEFIGAIEFDIPKTEESLSLYKVSQRKDLDISCVNAAFRISWADKKKTQIKQARIALGGVAATPLRLLKTEAALEGTVADSESLSRALNILHSEMEPLSDLRGSSAFRRVVAENLFFRFFREVKA